MPKMCLTSPQPPGMPPIKYLQLPVLRKTMCFKKKLQLPRPLFSTCVDISIPIVVLPF